MVINEYDKLKLDKLVGLITQSEYIPTKTKEEMILFVKSETMPKNKSKALLLSRFRKKIKELSRIYDLMKDLGVE